ncbi:MAG: type II toxin-antitoxin system RelE/ParE family toxin [Candidatus Rokubacteria bacterium]|nr:type II toxin-antitoxin system RelE/ParE family toxin [Candidatus Rokubacteria bacterium]
MTWTQRGKRWRSPAPSPGRRSRRLSACSAARLAWLTTVEFKPSAAKALTGLPRADQRRIAAKIDSLTTNPRPHGVEKLEGLQELYRVRAGDYRVVYQILDDRLLVLIVRIGHRRDVYR